METAQLQGMGAGNSGIFALAKLQEPVGEAPRGLVVLDTPSPFFLVTAKQGRWITENFLALCIILHS